MPNCIQRIAFAILLVSSLSAFSTPKNTTALCYSDPLQSSMVIQQNKPFKVWGYANPGKAVKIEADWLIGAVTVTATADGKFCGIITVPTAKKGDFTAHSITISSGKERKTLSDLLIGDVWLCSGQSNMQFSMSELADPAKEIAAVNNPNLRILIVNFNWLSKPTEHFEGKWAKALPQNMAKVSAIGYYFGEELQRKLNIPVGIIYSGVGGSVAQAYVSHDVLAADKQLKDAYLEKFYQTDQYKNNNLDPFSFATTSMPYLIYNGMIYPLLNLSIRGVCWYQGESNREQRGNYVRLMTTLIGSWREQFNQPDLPFYYVQVSPHAYQKMDPLLNDYAFFREEQEKIARLNNTAMVVTMDVGDAVDIHPKNKRPVASRLAKIALNRTYNMPYVNYQGPHYQYLSVDKNKAIVHFEPESIKAGLKTTDGSAPKHFMLAGDDQVFYPAEAVISGSDIIVSADKVSKPVAVRYAFTNYPTTNLQNGDDLPAVPFRTDSWPEPASNNAKP